MAIDDLDGARTGIAALLHLVEALPADLDVMVVGTTGHELHHLGLLQFLAVSSADLGDGPRAVMHLGASVGACEPAVDASAPVPSAGRMVFHRTPRASVVEPLTAVGFRPVHNPADWLGEGRNWSALSAPLVSLIGVFSRFHTPGDVAFSTTDPQTLDTACAAVSDVAGRLLDFC